MGELAHPAILSAPNFGNAITLRFSLRVTKVKLVNLHFSRLSLLEVSLIPKPDVAARPGDFVGRKVQIDAFRSILKQGVETAITSSVAVPGDWGIGKSSLLPKLNATRAESGYRMLPVFFSFPTDVGDYLRLTSLIGKLPETLATSSLAVHMRSEFQKWRLRRASLAGLQFDREAFPFFLSSGSALLRHTLAELWERFLRPAHFGGAMFFLKDLHNFGAHNPEAIASALRDQFQSFAIDDLNEADEGNLDRPKLVNNSNACTFDGSRIKACSFAQGEAARRFTIHYSSYPCKG